MMIRAIFLSGCLLLAGCSTVSSNAGKATQSTSQMAGNVGSASASAMRQTGAGMKDAALSPLEDLNLRRDEIPERLAVMQSPYVLPVDLTCEDLERRVGQLDNILGDDWDAPEGEDRLRSERLADGAAGAALNAISSEARGMIPFRGVVRYATGATKHEKAYKRAYRLGSHRRSYLKGIGLAMGCDAPASPRALPGRIVGIDLTGLNEPLVVGLPEATSSSDDVSVVTQASAPQALRENRPLITYRQSQPDAQTTSSPPNAPTALNAGQETSRSQ